MLISESRVIIGYCSPSNVSPCINRILVSGFYLKGLIYFDGIPVDIERNVITPCLTGLSLFSPLILEMVGTCKRVIG